MEKQAEEQKKKEEASKRDADAHIRPISKKIVWGNHDVIHEPPKNDAIKYSKVKDDSKIELSENMANFMSGKEREMLK